MESLNIDFHQVSKKDVIEKFFSEVSPLGNRICTLSDSWRLNTYNNLEHYEMDERGNKTFVPVSWKIFYDFLLNIRFFQLERKNKEAAFYHLDWSFIKDIDV